MFKRSKHGAIKALKGLASSKTRSKYQFDFVVDSVDVVPIEAKKEVGFQYRIRQSSTKGSLPSQTVPNNKQIIWNTSFSIQVKFTHQGNKVLKDKILRIDLIDETTQKDFATTQIKLSEMISTPPGKDLALMLQFPKKWRPSSPSILHISCTSKLLRIGNRVVQSQIEDSVEEDSINLRDSCILDGKAYLLGEFEESEITDSSMGNSDEDTEDPFEDSATTEFSDSSQREEKSEKEPSEPQVRLRKEKKKRKQRNSDPQINTTAEKKKNTKKPKLIVSLDLEGTTEESESESCKKSPRISNLLSVLKKPDNKGTRSCPHSPLLEDASEEKPAKAQGFLSLDLETLREESESSVAEPGFTSVEDIMPKKSPRNNISSLSAKLPRFIGKEKKQITPPTKRNPARASARLAIQKKLVEAEHELAEISAEKARLEEEQNRFFKSTIALKAELRELQQKNSQLDREVFHAVVANERTQVQIDKIHRSVEQVGGTISRDFSVADTPELIQIRKHQDDNFILFISSSTFLTLCCLLLFHLCF